MLPDVFSSSEQFDEWFNLDTDDREAKQRMVGQLHKLLRPFMLRRLKLDVETSLPPKTETILYIGMSAMQKKLYKDLLTRDKDLILNEKSSGSRTAILNIVMQMRKCCNHPYLFAGVEDRSLDPHGEHVIENCGKLVLLDKLLRRLHEKGHRVLIFSQMTVSAGAPRTALKPHRGIPTRTLEPPAANDRRPRGLPMDAAVQVLSD